MPRKPRKPKNMRPGPISPGLRTFFETGACGHQTEEDFTIFLLCCDDQKVRAAWNLYRDQVIGDFIERNPCSRPFGWWQWDSPRHDTGSGAYFEPLPIPRHRIRGKGQTTPEKYPAVVPSFYKGIPSSWAEIDPADPPTFESQAAYLERHGVLTASEKKYLASHLELMEPERITLTKPGDENAG